MDSLFVAMSRNTGHKKCKNDYERTVDSWDLVLPRTCAYVGENGGPADWKDWPPRANTVINNKVYWYKVAGDVYRQFGKDKFYPVQGLAVYDTWMPTVIQNNTFVNFFSKDGDAHRHAVGAHLGNEFQMSIKNFIMINNTVSIQYK